MRIICNFTAYSDPQRTILLVRELFMFDSPLLGLSSYRLITDQFPGEGSTTDLGVVPLIWRWGYHLSVGGGTTDLEVGVPLI